MNNSDPQPAIGRAEKHHRHAGPLAAASVGDSHVAGTHIRFRLFILEEDKVQDLTFQEFSALPSRLDHNGLMWLHVQGGWGCSHISPL